jgi:hypothetical protein
VIDGNIDESLYEEQKIQEDPSIDEDNDDIVYNLEEEYQKQQENKSRPEELYKLIERSLQKFYELMNNEAKTLGLKRSNFASAHGMYVEANVSTACDIARLCFFIMKNDTFR